MHSRFLPALRAYNSPDNCSRLKARARITSAFGRESATSRGVACILFDDDIRLLYPRITSIAILYLAYSRLPEGSGFTKTAIKWLRRKGKRPSSMARPQESGATRRAIGGASVRLRI